MQTLIANQLVDEYFLTIHPLTLGAGKRLFQDHQHPQDLYLEKSLTTEKGVIALTYRVKS